MKMCSLTNRTRHKWSRLLDSHVIVSVMRSIRLVDKELYHDKFSHLILRDKTKRPVWRRCQQQPERLSQQLFPTPVKLDSHSRTQGFVHQALLSSRRQVVLALTSMAVIFVECSSAEHYRVTSLRSFWLRLELRVGEEWIASVNKRLNLIGGRSNQS